MYISCHASVVECNKWDRILTCLELGLKSIRANLADATRNLPLEDRSKEDLVYQNFMSWTTQGLYDVEIKINGKGPNEVSLRETEAQWVYRLRSLSPLGINLDDFFIRKKRS